MSKDCESQIAAKYTKLDPKQIERISKDVQDIIKKANKDGVPADKAIKDAMTEYSEKIMVDRARTVATVQKVEARLKYMDDPQFKGDPAKAIESMLIADASGSFKGVGNIENLRKTMMSRYGSMIEQQLGEIPGGTNRMKSGSEDKVIIDILTGKKTNASAEQVKMANVVRKVNDGLLEDKNAAGFLVRKKEGRLYKQKYKKQAMLDFDAGSGGKKWKAEFRNNVDLEEMGYKNTADQEKFLHKMWTERTKEGGDWFEVDDDFMGIKVNAAQNKMEAKSSVVWKSAQHQLDYNKKVNQQTLYDMLAEEVMTDSGDIAAATLFGPNYKAGFKKLMTAAKDKASGFDVPEKLNIKDVLDPKKAIDKVKKKMDYNPVNPTREKQLKDYFKYATQPSRQPARNLWAKFGDKSRKLVDMARLDKAIFTTVTDFAYGSGIINKETGKNILHSNVDLIRDFTKQLNPMNQGQTKKWASKMNVFMDDVISQQSVRGITEEGSKTSWFDKGHNAIMNMTLLQQQSQKMRVGIAKQLTTIFDGESNKAFGDLWDTSGLERHGIGEKEWDVIRKSSGDFGDGTKGLLPENIENNAIADKWSNYLSWAAENGSPTAGAKRTAWKGAVDPNSFGGQMMLFMGQYKSFTLSMFDTMGQISKNKSGKMDVGRTGQVAALATVYGGMALTLKHLAKGESLDDLDVTTPEFFANAFAQGGAGMIAFDFMSGDYDKQWKSLAKDVAGPAFGMADDFMGLFSKAMKGDLKAKHVIKQIERNSPTIPIIGHVLKKKMFEGINHALNTD